MRALAFLLLSVPLFAAGCAPDCPGAPGCAIGPSCRSTCDRLLGDSDGQCNLQVPGKSDVSERQALYNDCVAHCSAAMKKNGEVGDYSPNDRSSGADLVALENEKQAALWMDCVAETDCSLLEQNYCAPTTNFPNGE